MVKILRKNKQWFLAAFGVLLLVTFLFTGTSSMFQPDPTKTKVAFIGTSAITAGESERAQREFEVLKNLAPVFVQNQLAIESGVHWQLLVREAERAGLVGEAGDGMEWMSKELPETEAMLRLMGQYTQQYGEQLATQLLSMPSMTQPTIDQVKSDMVTLRPRLAGDGRMTLDQFDAAVARLRGVVRLLNAYNRAARISDKQVVSDARQLAESVLADVIIVPASRIATDAPTPSEVEVVGHYETFRTVKPGEGDRGFGYVQPERVKIEYIEISRTNVGQTILLDPIAVNKYYQQHRSEFPGEYAAERIAVEKKLRDTRTDEILQQWDSVYKLRVKSALRGVASDAGYRMLPADWASKRPTLETLARDVTQTVSETTGVPLAVPTVRVLARDWTRLDKVAEVPVLGKATFAVGTRQATISQVLYSMHEFAPDSSLGFQAMVPFDQYLSAENGDRIYICVLDHRAPGAPESLDEVRTQVVRDLRLSWAFDQLGTKLPELKAKAAAEGLEAVGKLYESPAAGAALTPIVNVRVQGAGISDSRVRALNEPAVCEALMSAAAQLGMLTAPTPETLAQRTHAFELPKSLSVAVVQLTYPRPFTKEDLRMLSRNEYQLLLRREVREAAPEAKNPFSYESLSKRLEYREIKASGEPAEAPAKQ